MSDHNQKERDHVTGVETTGHEWDGIKELNNPAPRWWLWVFYITIIWSIGYWVVYPAWPTLSGHTKGQWEWTQYKKLEMEQAEINAIKKDRETALAQLPITEVKQHPELYEFAVAGGASLFKENCATCHGTGGAGANGYPNLNDDDWLWGGSVTEIYNTILHGIRSKDKDTRFSEMPSFGKGGLLTREQIEKTTNYVLSLSGVYKGTDTAEGMAIYAQNCASCHGADGKGGRQFGAPNLADKIWLYGGDHESVFNSIYNPHKGVMPNWSTRMTESNMRQLALYVHSLGGGEAEKVAEDITVTEANGVTTQPQVDTTQSVTPDQTGNTTQESGVTPQ